MTDAGRLTSFKRELTHFKRLRDALGKREDIAALLEVELGQPPFFLESEYVAGDLRDWGEAAGRLVSLPLGERLRLIAEIGRAVVAAHSVGIIHKDLKPSNIFMRQDSDGRWHPIVADFGIGPSRTARSWSDAGSPSLASRGRYWTPVPAGPAFLSLTPRFGIWCATRE